VLAMLRDAAGVLRAKGILRFVDAPARARWSILWAAASMSAMSDHGAITQRRGWCC
jgi:hypothetical protein